MRKNTLTETVANMEVGDQGITLVGMNLRAEIDFKSKVVASLKESTPFTIIETGESHRALISVGNATGWISTKTDLDQPLAKKVQSGGGFLPVYENAVALTLREKMDFKSDILYTLPEGSQFELIEEGPQHRVKILFDGLIGWITAKTDLDQPLIQSLSMHPSTRLAKNLDTYVVTKVLSSRSVGSLGSD